MQSDSRSKALTSQCLEDQENEVMFFDAMYGQEDISMFQIIHADESSEYSFLYLPEDIEPEEVKPQYIVEQTIASEAPNLISQLRVRLEFRLGPLYPSVIPRIGCKSIVCASHEQCMELLRYIKKCAEERVGQVMLFDLVLLAGDWLSSCVREIHQGSLHETMLEMERRREHAEREKQEKLSAIAENQPPSLELLTHQRESEMRKQWLLNRSDLAAPPVARVKMPIESGSFATNLSYTMSRFIKSQGSSQIRPITSNGTTSSSLLQTVHVLQQSLLQQQFLTAHLMAHWIALTRTLTGSDVTDDIINYLCRDSILDSQQAELIKCPGRIPTSALFGNSDGSNPAVGLLTCPAEKLAARLNSYSSSGNQEMVSGNNNVPPTYTSGTTSRYQQDFEQLEYLGSGAFGDVWKVKNRLDGMYYAMKKVRIGKLTDSRSPDELVAANNKIINRILREVTTLGRIQSPYVLRYHQAWIEETIGAETDNKVVQLKRDDNTLRSSSFFEAHHMSPSDGGIISSGHQDTDGPMIGTKQLSLYIQTAYCPKTLSDFLINEGATATVTDLWRLCRMMLEGLAHIHSHGIMHRDMKPSNIFIDPNGDIRIGDFGLATFEKEAMDANETGMDQNENQELSTRVGTKLYASPEQEGETDGDYDERTDIYSLGVIFFELWHPFRTSFDRIETLTKLKQGIVPGRFAESHPRQWKLISTMMNRNIQERPTATMILQSDMLPPRMEDDFLNDALRVVSNPNTPIFPKILSKLFSHDRQSVLSKPWPVQTGSSQNLSQYNTMVPDALLSEQRKEWICSVIKRIFETHGAIRFGAPLFSPVSPDLKPREDETVLMDPNGSLLSLRYDSRSTFINMVLSALTEPTSPIPQDTLFKRYDINTVYRKSSRNGYQPIELIRGEFDIIGVDPVVAECECLSLVSEVISDFEQDIEWVRICINHRALFNFIMDAADISPTQLPIVCRALLDASYAPSTSSRIEKWDVLRKSLLSCGARLSDKQINMLGRWYRTSTGSVTDAMVAIREEFDDDSLFHAGYLQVSKLVSFLDTSLGANFRENEIMLDFCFPPPSDDNDGLYFRVEVAYINQPDVGEAIAVGGRVDSSLRKHVDTSLYRMVSMTWNLSKLIMNVTVGPVGLLGSPDVLVCAQRDSRNDDPATLDMNAEQLSVSLEIRKIGLSADIFHGSASLQEQLEFALARGVRYMVIIREKDLTTQLTDGTREKVNDYIVSMRVLTGGRTKQVRETSMRKSELKNHLAHRTY